MAKGARKDNDRRVATLSERDDRDQSAIYVYTAQQWGETQAEEYLEFLGEILQQLADSPAVAPLVPNLNGVRSYLCALTYDYGAADDGRLGTILASLGLNPNSLYDGLLRVERRIYLSKPPNPLAPFDKDAKGVVERAEEISRQAFCGKISPGHLALAVLQSRTMMIAKLFDAAGIGLEVIQENLRNALVSDHAIAAPGLHFSPETKMVLDRALKTALPGPGSISALDLLEALLTVEHRGITFIDCLAKSGVKPRDLLKTLRALPLRSAPAMPHLQPISVLGSRCLEDALLSAHARGGAVLRLDLLLAIFAQADSIAMEVVSATGGKLSDILRWLEAERPAVTRQTPRTSGRVGQYSPLANAAILTARNCANFVRNVHLAPEHILLALIDQNISMKPNPRHLSRGDQTAIWSEARASQLLYEMEQKGVRAGLKSTLGWEDVTLLTTGRHVKSVWGEFARRRQQ